MKKNIDIRRLAEEKAALTPENIAMMSAGDIKDMIHELHVHQIELEMQNEELRVTQVELDTARERYFDLYDLAPVGYFTISEKGLITEANLTAANMLGIHRRELIKQPFSKFIVAEDQDTYYLRCKQLFDIQEPQLFDIRMKKQNGEICWVYLAATAVTAGDKTIICRLTINDISERKQSEDVQNFLAQTSTMVADESFFKVLARYLAQSFDMDFVCIDRLEDDGLNARTLAVWCDGEFEDNVSYALKDTPCGEVVGKTVCCFPASVCQFFPFDQVLVDLKAESYVGVTLWSHTGQPIGLIAVIGRKEMTNRAKVESILKQISIRAAGELERLFAEEALRKSQEQYYALFEQAGDGLVILDTDGKIISFNKTFARMHGYTVEEMLQFKLNELNVEGSSSLPDRLHQIINGGTIAFEVNHYHKDGFTFPISVTANIIAVNDSTLIMAIHHDITERKKIEKALRESEERYSRAFMTSPYAITITNMKDGKFVEVNDAFTTITGYTREEAIGDSSIGLNLWVNSADREKIISSLQQGKDVSAFECKFKRKDDSIIIGLISSDIIYLDSKPYILSSINDITESKQAEEKIREKDIQFRKLSMNVPDLIFQFTRRTDGTYYVPIASEGIKNIFGCSPDDVADNFEPISRVIHPEDIERVIRDIEYSAEHLTYFTCEFRVLIPGRPVQWIYSNSTPEKLSDGSVTWYGFNTDITKRKKAEDEIERNVSRLKMLVDILQHSSDTIQEFLDYALEQAIQLTTSKIGYIYYYHEDTKEFILNTWSKDVMPECAVANPQSRYELDKTGIWGEAVRQRKPIIVNDFPADNPLKKGHPEGHVILTNFMTVPIFRVGEIIGVVGLANKDADYDETDVLQISLLMEAVWKVTDRLQMQDEKDKLVEQLLQSQKMESVGRLAGGVAHDFNNMLQVILGNAYLSMNEVPANSSVAESLQQIIECGNRSADLTQKLLTFARKQVIVPQLIDLNETVEGMLKMLRRLIGEDVDLVWLPQTGLWPVKIDPSQVDQILANLCVNARDAIANIGKITIETENKTLDNNYCANHVDFIPGEYVCISVSDNGTGIDKDILENIFEPFFTTKEMGKGTGLGLATVYGAVKQNNGFINAYSELGKGTVFSIYLPRFIDETLLIEAETEKESAPGGNDTILMVEDELTILSLGKRMLSQLGYNVLIASSPNEAVSIINEHTGRINLLITDVIMPEMNGRDLAVKLLKLNPEMKILFMSGYTADVIARHGVLEEEMHFIQKPFTMDDLAAKVREALR